MRLKFRNLLYVVVLVVATVSPLSATTAIEMSVSDLATQANVIVIGKVMDQTSRWADTRTLVTDVSIQVGEVLKGEAGATITVTLPGGVDANRKIPIAMSFPAAPQLQVGENTFLFLVRDEVEGLGIAGWSQGKYSIISDGTEQYVARDLTQLRLSTGTGVVRGGTATNQSLKEFRAEVAQSLKGN